MSWSIYATGIRKKVRAVVEADTQVVTEQDLIEYNAAKAMILARIDSVKLPAERKSRYDPNAIRVEASGHGHDGGASLKVEVVTVCLEL